MRVLLVFEAKGRDGLAQTNPVANGVLQRRIVLLHDVNHLVAVHGLDHFTFMRLTETSNEHLAEILLLHEVLIQLLNTGHLVVVEPIGCLLLLKFVDHLRIKLAVVNVTRIVDQLPIRNQNADISTRSCDILQRMTVVGGGYERRESWEILLSK